MAPVEVKTRAPKAPGSTGDEVVEHTVVFDFGDSASDAINRYGDEVVYDKYQGQARVDLQSLVRRMLEAGCTAEAIDDAVAGWRPGMKAPSVKTDPKRAIINELMGMDESARAQYLQQLQADLASVS